MIYIGIVISSKLESNLKASVDVHNEVYSVLSCLGGNTESSDFKLVHFLSGIG